MSLTVTGGELRAALDVAGAASGRGELPDPVSWRDLRERPDATLEVLRARVAEGRTPNRGQVFRWPKENGDYRPMAWIDPLDQVIYRAVVGRFVAPIASSVDGDRVLAVRVQGRLPRWELEPYGKAVAERRRLGQQLLSRHWVLGVIDVKDFFPSVRRPALEVTLGRLPLHAESFAWLLEWLDELDEVSGIKGLPTGPEPSRVLGNGMLVVCDEMLASLAVDFLRYVDDTWLFLDHVAEFEALRARYGDELRALGLGINAAKSRALEGEEALNEVRRTAIAYVEEEVRDEGRAGLSAARELFAFALEDPAARKSELRFALSALGRQRDASPLEALRGDADLLRYGPRQWVGYLQSMVDARPTRRLVGDDWLVSQITEPVTKDDGYRNLLYLQVAARLHLSKDLGRRVFEVATCDGGWNAPVRVWAAHVWGLSDAFRPNLAVEQVEERGDFSTKRAFALTLDRKRSDRNARRWLRRVRLAAPELEPTASWLEAA